MTMGMWNDENGEKCLTKNNSSILSCFELTDQNAAAGSQGKPKSAERP